MPVRLPAYVGFALEVLELRNGQDLDPVFREDHWRVCSALVADSYAYAGLNLEAGLKYPNLISPADLYNMIARRAEVTYCGTAWSGAGRRWRTAPSRARSPG